MFRIALNTGIRDNNAFFCPDTRLHLTLANPVGTTDRVSPAIERGIKGKTLIDVDGLTGKPEVKQPVQDKKNVDPEPKNEPAPQQPSQEEDVFSQLEGAGVQPEEKKTARKTKKAAKTETE